MRKTAVTLVLGASVLMSYDPVELVVYLDAPPGATPIDTIVADAACQHLSAEQVPLPVPYTVRIFERAGESQRFVPARSPIATGLLSRCPVAPEPREAQGAVPRMR